MNVAVIGSGARESAIAMKLSMSKNVKRLFSLPGNAGSPNQIAIDPCDFVGLISFCREEKIDLVVPGPEKPLVEGLTDVLGSEGIKVIGPRKDAARLEGSKIWAKDFMTRSEVATAQYVRVTGKDDALKRIDTWEGKGVIKLDGLAAGKGVFVCHDLSSAEKALDELVRKHGGLPPCIVEELLEGPELSVIGFTDGIHFSMLHPSRDHKRLLDGDKGPNTGGMGAFCPVPTEKSLLKKIFDDIVQPTLKGLNREKIEYRGMIYFGIMLTVAGPKLLEYNVRLGDPEAQVLLPAMTCDLAEAFSACLESGVGSLKMTFNPGFYVGVVLAAPDYPVKGSYDEKITGLENCSTETLIFHGATKLCGDSLCTAGGRILTLVSHGETIEMARGKVYADCGKIDFKGRFFRSDIASNVFPVTRQTGGNLSE